MPRYLDTTFKKFPFAALSQTDDDTVVSQPPDDLFEDDDSWRYVDDMDEINRIIHEELHRTR